MAEIKQECTNNRSCIAFWLWINCRSDTKNFIKRINYNKVRIEPFHPHLLQRAIPDYF
jgi:hypothetical protein